MEAYSLTLKDCAAMSLPDIATLCTKLGPTPSEPEWFVRSVRGTKDPKARLQALCRLMEG